MCYMRSEWDAAQLVTLQVFQQSKLGLQSNMLERTRRKCALWLSFSHSSFSWGWPMIFQHSLPGVTWSHRQHAGQQYGHSPARLQSELAWNCSSFRLSSSCEWACLKPWIALESCNDIISTWLVITSFSGLSNGACFAFFRVLLNGSSVLHTTYLCVYLLLFFFCDI